MLSPPAGCLKAGYLLHVDMPSAGHGIGLAIVKHLVEAHGGTISVSSAQGRGCHFELRLPRAPQARQARKRRSPATPPAHLSDDADRRLTGA